MSNDTANANFEDYFIPVAISLISRADSC